jgi:hypothetical protein
MEGLPEHDLRGEVRGGDRDADHAVVRPHPAAEYRLCQEQRERAAEADSQRREAAEQQLDETWARAEWFKRRKRKVNRLAGL